MHLRARTDRDLDACVRLVRVVHDLDGFPPRLADDLSRFVASPGALGAWVAEEDGALAGHVALLARGSEEVMALACAVTGREPNQLGLVARLFVSPEHRRRGVAASLLERASADALARGLLPVLDVAAHFAGAIRLYERCGWICAGRVTVDFADAEPLDELVYIRA